MSSSALRAVKSFRLKEINDLPRHIIRYGALPEPTSPGALKLPNPFVPHRNPNSGRWHGPKISLRRQADLIKRAKESDTLHLLPPGPKAPRPTELGLRLAAIKARAGLGVEQKGKTPELHEEKQDAIWMKPVEWEGKAEFKEAAGADVGTRLYASRKRMFKGHKWERVKEARDSKKKILLRDMARRVKNYKAYYHRRKPNPLKTSGSKVRKLPF